MREHLWSWFLRRGEIKRTEVGIWHICHVIINSVMILHLSFLFKGVYLQNENRKERVSNNGIARAFVTRGETIESQGTSYILNASSES